MFDNTVAQGLWCPFTLTQSESKTSQSKYKFGDDKGGKDGGITADANEIVVKFVAVSAINRNEDGTPHADCMCIGTECIAWVDVAGGLGCCSKLDHNRQR